MRVTKNEIKNWMKENNLERAWLAKECGVSKATVDTWLSSDRGVPSKAQLTIQTLIFKSPERRSTGLNSTVKLKWRQSSGYPWK